MVRLIPGNMACTEEAAIKMTQNEKLIKLMLLVLNDHDAPTLVESTRLISVSLAHSSAREPWLQAIREESMTGQLLQIFWTQFQFLISD